MLRPSSRQLVKALEADGFVAARRARGSHQAFQKKVEGRTVTVTVVLGRSELPSGLVRSVLRQWGITEDELRDLIG